MAAGWVKSLQCKSRAFEDVYRPLPNAKQLLLPSTSCRNTFQNLRDVVGNTRDPNPKPPKPKPRKPDPDTHPKRSLHPHKRRPSSLPRRSESAKAKPDPDSSPQHIRVRRTLSAPIKAGPLDSSSFFPSLSELPAGHPSRNVVEIIFHTRWSPKGFSGRVEMVFKIQNMPRTVARFEEFRDNVKVRAGSGSAARCSADGNEMMRFRCLGPTTSAGVIIDVGDCCGGGGGKGSTSASICTYSGSGAAHDSTGGGRGRRAMLVCRVIAGRVSKRVGPDGYGSGELEFDSVSGENGELLVFDSRAVLPCFLVIYKL